MNKDKITKYQWKKYLLVQKSGSINMNDIRRGAFLIGESQEIYETILHNYAFLRQKYGI